MKNRKRKREIYLRANLKKLCVKTIKGLVKKPVHSVSVEDMNQAIEDAAFSGWAKDRQSMRLDAHEGED